MLLEDGGGKGFGVTLGMSRRERSGNFGADGATGGGGRAALAVGEGLLVSARSCWKSWLNELDVVSTSDIGIVVKPSGLGSASVKSSCLGQGLLGEDGR